MNRRREWTAITLILLLAAGLRFWNLGDVPPGPSHDEVANWLIAQDVLSGDHALYFTAAYGHEPLYQYVQAATVALFGDHWLGLRWPSVALGMLGIAATYALVRRLFDVPTALLTAAWLAVSFWPLFYARVALRAISLPFTAALAACFLFRAHDQYTKIPIYQSTNTLLSGLFLGLSLYTYMAARILPFIFATFLIYSYLLSRSSASLLPRSPAALPLCTSAPPHLCSSTPLLLRTSALLFLTAALVSAPLVIWLATHPGAEYRITEIRAPLDRLLAGDPSLVWQNLIANLKSFTFVGDPWPQQNLPGRPVFAEPVSAALFYAGVLIALWRWRDPRYSFLLIWLIGSLGPSVATSVAPSSIRDILGLTVVFVFPALALVEAARWLKRKVQNARCRMHDRRFLLPTPYSLLSISCFLLLTPCFLLTTRDYFVRWPQHKVARYFYQAQLTAVARRLDELPPETAVAVAGRSVHSMDRPTLELTSRRDVRDVRLCDLHQVRTLVVPAGPDARLFVPRRIPFDEDLRRRLLAWGPKVETDERGALGEESSSISYRLSDRSALERDLERLEDEAALPDGSLVDLPASFGGHLAFLGYEWLQRDGRSLRLLTYSRVEEPPSTPLKIFVHLLDKVDEIVAQHDGLGSPPQGWAPGDLIVQKHVVIPSASLASGQYRLRVGVYRDTASGERLPVLTADHLLLPVRREIPRSERN